LYFLKEKRFLILFLLMVQSFSLFSQVDKSVIDTLLIKRDTVITDTILTNIRHPSPSAIDKKVTYTAVDYRKVDIINRQVVLIGSAKVNYGEIEIKADSIVFNMKTNLLFAVGRKDTTGKIAGRPVFKEGSQEFEADELTYNFKTHKALIKNIVTKQEDGLIHSAFTKLLEDKTSNISRSTYSTCDADTPHFYINLPKAKVYPGKKIISGPGNLVLEGIPLPLVIPFGFFPIQTKKAASGLLIPRIGEERERGYSLTEGGYYFAISNYFDLAVKGSLYSNGTWLATTQTSYNRLYKYSGTFAFSYANNISGHKGLPDYSKSTNYRIGWNYNQDPKASPGSRFSASVNMSSSGFDRNNSYTVAEHVTTQRQSSVSYSKTWDGTPFNLSASMNHSQNVKNKTVSLNLPKVNFNISRLYPLKGKNSTGPAKWYQELQLSYTASLDNQINTYDSLLFTNEVWNNMRNGFKHEIPLSFQIRPFRNFSISPSVTYSGVLYSQKIEKNWVPDYYDKEIGKIVPSVVNDTLRGAFYGQAFNPSISASFSPQIFGMYSFTNPNSRLQAIRHVVKPSVSFSFVPALERQTAKMYRQVQIDTTGRNFSEYSIFEGNIFGTPSASGKSGNVSLSLVNILEAKVFARDDTTGKARKIKLIDNFSINTAYNIFADSMKWAPVSMQIRTTILDKINISANSSFSLYGVNSKGMPIATFAYAQNKKLLRLTNFTTSLDFSLSELLKGNKGNKKPNPPQNALNNSFDANTGMSKPDYLSQPNTGAGLTDEYGYPVFNVPWSLNLSYSLNYYMSASKANISQTLSFSGNFTLTKKMSVTYTSGYDFTGKQITMTQIGITRDLHCWDMNFNWVPNGSMQMWNFTIKVKAAVLGDLKYERRKDFHDNY
jgi:lipopolysaccharide assembly outer membrane protein LptD (OstA)